jgi:hypothetical protein
MEKTGHHRRFLMSSPVSPVRLVDGGPVTRVNGETGGRCTVTVASLIY